jgi:hypothetical protein
LRAHHRAASAEGQVNIWLNLSGPKAAGEKERLSLQNSFAVNHGDDRYLILLHLIDDPVVVRKYFPNPLVVKFWNFTARKRERSRCANSTQDISCDGSTVGRRLLLDVIGQTNRSAICSGSIQLLSGNRPVCQYILNSATHVIENVQVVLDIFEGAIVRPLLLDVLFYSAYVCFSLLESTIEIRAIGRRSYVFRRSLRLLWYQNRMKTVVTH